MSLNLVMNMVISNIVSLDHSAVSTDLVLSWRPERGVEICTVSKRVNEGRYKEKTNQTISSTFSNFIYHTKYQNRVPGSTFPSVQTLGGRGEGCSNWVPTTYVEDLH